MNWTLKRIFLLKQQKQNDFYEKMPKVENMAIITLQIMKK